MINCIIICITIFISLVYTLHWFRKMAKEQLPHFSIGYLENKQEEPVNSTNQIGFTVAEAESEDENLSDQQLKLATLKDMASTYNAILRGDWDLDELGK